MINGCEVQVGFSGDVTEALRLMSDELEKLGYAQKSLEGSELVMKFKGKWITADPEKMQHTLKVAPGDGGLAFRFGTGLIASHWTNSDQEWAKKRATEVVAAVTAQM